MPRSRLWLLPLMLAAMLAGGWYFSFRSKAGDRELPVYVTGAERMLAGEEIYRRWTDKKPFTYPPFAALLFAPFSLLPAGWQPPLWFVANWIVLLCLLRWLHGWGTAPQPGAPPRAGLFWLLTALVGGHHVVSVFAYQSHDLLILGTAALATAAWCRQRTVAGLWAGVGAAIKATPLLFVVLFAQRRRFGAAALVAGTCLVLSLLPDLLLPRAAGGSWLWAWFEGNLRGIELGGAAGTAGIWNPHSFLNQSLSGTLTRLLTPAAHPGTFVDEQAVLVPVSAAAAKAVTLVAQLGVLALVVWTVHRAGAAVRRAGDAAAAQGRVALAETGAILCGMVLLSPQSSKTHFCVWLVPAAFLADRLLRGPRDRVLQCLVAAAAVLATLPAKGLVGQDLGNRLLAYGIVTWATVAMLLALLRALRPPVAAAPLPAAAVQKPCSTVTTSST